uniref:Uncharacterized protein LOC108949709 n=1 Tax=Phallusia mammillata TaxID=59560 RepID=A0A6F9DJ79_9ASCI|nr:uncharacterized protein LOC108949709 [Phallusia mammillata]
MNGDPYLTVDNGTRPSLYFQSRGKTYDEAITSCQMDYGGKLAVLKEPGFLDRISDVIPTAYSHYYRIGLKKEVNEDVFRWEDGSLFKDGALTIPDVAETNDCLAMSVYKPIGSSHVLLRPVECDRALAYICQSVESPDDLNGSQTIERVALAAAIATAATVCLLLVVAFLAVFLIRRKWAIKERKTKRETKTSTTTVLTSDSEHAETPSNEPSFNTLSANQGTIPAYQDVGYCSVDELAEQGAFDLESGGSEVHKTASTQVYTMAEDVTDVSALYSVVNKKTKRNAVKNEKDSFDDVTSNG